MTKATKQLGKLGEDIAAKWLKAEGHTILHRNWRAGRVGEVDLITLTPDNHLAFIEVKTRRSRHLQDAMEIALAAITPAKQHQLAQLAEIFLSENAGYQSHTCQLDALAVAYPTPDRPHEQLYDEHQLPQVGYIPNAFLG